MLGILKDSIESEFEHIRDGIKSMSEDIVGGIGAIFSLLTFVAGIICFAIQIIAFATNGGFDNIFSNLFSLRGNASAFYKMPYLIILGALNIALLLMSYILFFKKEKVVFKILGIIPLAVVMIGFVGYFVMLGLYNAGKIGRNAVSPAFAKGCVIAVMIAVILSIVLLLIREKEMSRSCLRLLVLSFVILPLLTLCIENIALLIVGVVVFVALCIFVKGGSGSSSSHDEPVRKEPAKREPVKANNDTAKPTGLTKEQQNAIYDINRRYKEGCAAIVKANGDNGAYINSEKTTREIAELRNRLEKEAVEKGVKGKVSIY